jgi:hypothetical protein
MKSHTHSPARIPADRVPGEDDSGAGGGDPVASRMVAGEVMVQSLPRSGSLSSRLAATLLFLLMCAPDSG